MGKDEGFSLGGPVTAVLALLRAGARHGYEIARDVERLSDNRLPFKYGTLYPVLYRLERDGFIVSVWEHPAGERKRRVYALTEKGIDEAERNIRAWTEYATAMHKVIEGSGGQQPA